MTKTYEITIESGSTSNSSTHKFETMAEAIAWAKEFAKDWFRGATYSIYCIEDETFEQGNAN